jgi:hypothetical protein
MLLALQCVAPLGTRAGIAQDTPATLPVEVRQDQERGVYTLRASDATLEEIGKALAQLTECTVEVDKRLRKERLTFHLTAPSPERLFPVLARGTFVRLSVVYRLKPAEPGDASPRGALVFTGQPISLDTAQPINVTDVGQHLGVPVDVEKGVQGRIQIRAARRPLAWIMDQIAAQVNARWENVIRLEARSLVDAEADDDERMHAHYADLARLSPAERREELASDLEAIEKLPPERWAEGMRRMADDLLSLATLLHGTPEEHRPYFTPRIRAIVGDYRTVLSRLRGERRAQLAPVFRALTDLQQHLAQIR